MSETKKRLVLESGPSGTGKTPKIKAIVKEYGQSFGRIILTTSRLRREGEVDKIDYYFKTADEIMGMPNDEIVARGSVRGEMIQAISKEAVNDAFERNDLVYVEAYPSLGENLLRWIKTQSDCSFEIRTVAFIPISWEEITQCSKSMRLPPEEIVYLTVKGKLERRGKDKPENIEKRARLAYYEMTLMRGYQHTIVCHVGEDEIEQWGEKLGFEPLRAKEEMLQIMDLT
ncbi:MAG: Guanylate kinase [Berkelbacteria bacterium GW2011_GWA1_36_9]|uniref:Guanylate kinase n=2 Tax=Candidatus Berkelbacteria TaxID=1618330 RepID=A0A0G0FLJ4_9BACT|nr:MAG: Guanylate kinase [Berkelbacteria bacterium GW2011_GWA1_36_9]